jgi:hypothetical protein
LRFAGRLALRLEPDRPVGFRGAAIGSVVEGLADALSALIPLPLLTQSGRLKGWGVWEDHQARDRRDASTLDILATPQFRKRAQKSDRDDGQNELRNDSR